MAEATIRDVARRAQVSVASVSRVLNRLDNVSEQTRERVKTAIDELGYVPHAGARSLSLARTGAIGVVLPNLHGEFFSEIVRGMDRVATARGYLLLLSNMHGHSGSDQAVIKAMHGRVDGLIVMAPHLEDEEFATALPRGIPAVLVNSRAKVGARPSIHLDNAAGARAVAQHLMDIGRRRIVHIAGPLGNIDAEERADAFVRELKTRPGIECETETSVADAGVAVRPLDDTPPLTRQLRVGMEKQQPAAVRDRGTGVHLPRAAPRGGDPDKIGARSAKVRQRHIPFGARDDHFGVTEARCLQRPREHASVAVNGDDNGHQH